MASKYWNRQLPKMQLPPKPAEKPAAYRIGQMAFLSMEPCNPHAFRVPELQEEYAAGWLAEARDLAS